VEDSEGSRMTTEVEVGSVITDQEGFRMSRDREGFRMNPDQEDFRMNRDQEDFRMNRDQEDFRMSPEVEVGSVITDQEGFRMSPEAGEMTLSARGGSEILRRELTAATGGGERRRVAREGKTPKVGVIPLQQI